jgi:hypothetical protein
VEDTIVDLVQGFARQYDVAAVGIGAAGFVDVTRTVVMFSPHLNWRREPLRAKVAERVRVPVVVDNDANTAALAELNLAGRLPPELGNAPALAELELGNVPALAELDLASRRSSAPSPPSRPAEVAHAADLHAGSPAVAAEAAPSPNPLPCSPRPTKAVLNEHESSHKVCSSFSISLICSSLIMYNHH